MAQNKPRFSLADYSDIEPELWTPDHIKCGAGFHCERQEFRTFWNKRIRRDFESSLGRCWVITENGHLAAYITLLADRLKVFGKDGVPLPILSATESVEYRRFPAIKIGLLARDDRAKGSGKRLVEWALDYVASEISPRIGARFIVVDALYDKEASPPYDASPYYKKFGFEYAKEDEALPPVNPYRTMFLDLKPYLEANADVSNHQKDPES